MQSNILDWIENTSKFMPDNIAICDEKSSLTYCDYRKKVKQ